MPQLLNALKSQQEEKVKKNVKEKKNTRSLTRICKKLGFPLGQSSLSVGSVRPLQPVRPLEPYENPD